MPYKIKKLPNTPDVQVINTDTKDVKAKQTTKTKAKKQINLLQHIEKTKSKK